MADTETFDLIVIGSGPGGYVAAVRAAQLGMRVACVERSPRLGGVCLNEGCIPSKALLDSSEYFHLAKNTFAEHGIRTGKVSVDLAALMARKDRVVGELTENVRKLLEGNRIAIVHGTARLETADTVTVAGPDSGAPATELRAKAILLATGSEPVEVPGLGFDTDRIVSSTGALAFDEVPNRLGVVGGGYIGLELGSVWGRLGAEVTVIEMMPRIAGLLDGQIGRALDRSLKRQGLAFRMNTRVAEAKITGKRRRVRTRLVFGEKTESITFDRLLVAVGRRPLTRGLGIEALGIDTDPKTGHVRVDARYQTGVSGVYAIGDLIDGPALAHKASAEGIAAVECIAGLPGEVNYDAIPSVIYTAPEVASVGLTEEAVKERGIAYGTGAYPFGGAARARCLGETEGFVKVIAHAKTDRVLGVHIIGPRAADMIAEAVMAMEFGAASEDIARAVHGHPTFSEALMEAARNVRAK
jgi:dihydrolipoyl dehydrogenase